MLLALMLLAVPFQLDKMETQDYVALSAASAIILVDTIQSAYNISDTQPRSFELPHGWSPAGHLHHEENPVISGLFGPNPSHLEFALTGAASLAALWIGTSYVPERIHDVPVRWMVPTIVGIIDGIVVAHSIIPTLSVQYSY